MLEKSTENLEEEHRINFSGAINKLNYDPNEKQIWVSTNASKNLYMYPYPPLNDVFDLYPIEIDTGYSSHKKNINSEFTHIYQLTSSLDMLLFELDQSN